MSDPFERLRSTSSGPAPDVDAIKSRARHIVHRRYIGMSAAAALIVLVGLGGVLIGNGPGGDSLRTLAQPGQTDSSGRAASPAPTSSAAAFQQAQERVTGNALSADTAESSGATGSAGAGAMAAEAPESADRAATAPSEASASGMSVTLTVANKSVGRGVNFNLRACNQTSQAIDVTFASGQRYDFEVSRDGKLVWRWSDGRAFTQIYGQERWEPGQCKSYNDSWDATDSNGSPVAPGTYKAVGILASDPPARSAAKSFCIDAC